MSCRFRLLPHGARTEPSGSTKSAWSGKAFSPERLQLLQKAYRYLLAAKLNTTQAVEKMRALEGEDVALLVRFIERSERGVIK